MGTGEGLNRSAAVQLLQRLLVVLDGCQGGSLNPFSLASKGCTGFCVYLQVPSAEASKLNT